jgi:hypothetical protein
MVQLAWRPCFATEHDRYNSCALLVLRRGSSVLFTLPKGAAAVPAGAARYAQCACSLQLA